MKILIGSKAYRIKEVNCGSHTEIQVFNALGRKVTDAGILDKVTDAMVAQGW